MTKILTYHPEREIPARSAGRWFDNLYVAVGVNLDPKPELLELLSRPEYARDCANGVYVVSESSDDESVVSVADQDGGIKPGTDDADLNDDVEDGGDADPIVAQPKPRRTKTARP